MNDLINWIAINYIELIGTITGVIGVYLTTRQIIWCWPVALISVSIYIYIFFSSRLYADFGLQVFYLGMTLYGWHNWMYGGKEKGKLKIEQLSLKTFLIFATGGSAAVFVLGYLLEQYTDASLPYWDAVTTIWGIIATKWP